MANIIAKRQNYSHSGETLLIQEDINQWRLSIYEFQREGLAKQQLVRPIIDMIYYTFLQQAQRMNYASRRDKQEREIMEENVGYAEGSVRQYLNIKRTSKDRCCTVIFCVYMLAVVIMTGIGFFYGNFTKIGTFLASGTECSKFLSYSETTNTYACDLVGCSASTYAFLQRVCVSSSYSVAPSDLVNQVSIYNYKFTFPLMLYMNIGIVVGCILLFSLLICYPKLFYAYTFTSFLILLGFAFYLLKTINDRIDSIITEYPSDPALSTSQILSDQQALQPLAYILLAFFLVFFPVILFSPGKIRLGVNILSNLYGYFEQSYTIVLFSMTVVLAIYIVVFVMGFLLLNFLTDGTLTTSDSSFFYLYEKINLAHPAALAFFFYGVYWLFTTFGNWHQIVISSSVLQWYFEDGGKLKPVRKGMKRAWYNLGSSALAAALLPIQWVALVLYSICKMDSDTVEQYQNEHHQDCLCLSNTVYKFRQLVTRFYIKVNRGSAIAATLSNNHYIQSCELAAVTFSQRKHRFFNIGGSITLFLCVFTSLLFLVINFFPLYYQNYDIFPPRISSLGLQMVTAIFLGLAVGFVLSNMFSASVDSLLFCFLVEKKGGQSVSDKEIKKLLEELYSAQDQITEVLEMYEVQSDTE